MRKKSKRFGTDGSLLTSLPWTLAALAFSILPHIQFLPIWVTAVFVVCSVWRLLVEKNRWRLPPAFLRIAVSLTCFILVIATYQSVSGVGPGSALLAVMAALKLLETKKRRDQFVLLFLSIFLIMASLLREQFLWSLPYLIAGTLLTMTAWMRMADTRPVPTAQSFRSSARLLLYAAPLTIAMWIFFPRIATPFWAVPIDTGAATSGLNDQMSPGDISSLSLSDAVAFRVNFSSEIPPPQERYWRGLVLNRFNGRTWSGNDPFLIRDRDREIEVSGEPVEYQITMEPTSQHWVIALDVPVDWTLSNTRMLAQQQLARMQPIDQRISYDVVSHTEFRLNNELSKFARDFYTRVPDNSNERTMSLARGMYDAAGSAEVYINNVLRMFNREAFFYTLEPPALGSNPVDAFLFDTRQGFCEHYASAFAVMMRAVGIPSRIVLGYQGGEINPLGQYMIVRQADAHAWTEVWLPRRGWYRVDPTAAVAPERIDAGRSAAMFEGIGANWGLNAPSQFLYQLTLTWDVMNAKWNEWILAYGPDNQGLFMEWMGMEDPDWRKMMLTLIGILGVLIALISFLIMRRYRPPPKDDAALLYRKFIRATGVDRPPAEPPLKFASRVSSERVELADDASDITSLYLDARYGPPELVAVSSLKSAITRFRERAR